MKWLIWLKLVFALLALVAEILIDCISQILSSAWYDKYIVQGSVKPWEIIIFCFILSVQKILYASYRDDENYVSCGSQTCDQGSGEFKWLDASKSNNSSHFVKSWVLKSWSTVLQFFPGDSCHNWWFFFFFFDLGFTAHQDYFAHFQLSQSQGGAKTGDPWEKPPYHPQADLGLSHMTQARLEPTAWRWRAI